MKNLQDRRIFIVDDDPFWTLILTQMLNEIGFTNILTFESGQECIDQLHLNPTIVFLDFQMEELDGLETLKAIKAYYPAICVFFSTSHEDLGVAMSAIRYGCDDYLLKENASPAELSRLVFEFEAKLN